MHNITFKTHAFSNDSGSFPLYIYFSHLYNRLDFFWTSLYKSNCSCLIRRVWKYQKKVFRIRLSKNTRYHKCQWIFSLWRRLIFLTFIFIIIIKYAYIAPILIRNYSRRFAYHNVHLQMDKILRAVLNKWK